MKVRESGMPPETMWASFFNVDYILNKLQINKDIMNLVEIGCGYGTFTIGAAKKITGKLFAYDIEQEMIDFTRKKAATEKLRNIQFYNRDIIAEGSGLEAETIDFVMLFNILHHHNPMELLGEAFKILKKSGKIGIIHWRTDMETPRGPDMSIRPTPEQCVDWAEMAGFKVRLKPEILEPYHYGLVIEKV